MAVTTVTINGVTIANPSEYRETYTHLGAARQMADGSIVRDLVNASSKSRFFLAWNRLTETQKDTLETTINTLAAATATVTFVAPDGSSYSVWQDPDSVESEFEMWTDGANTVLWRTTLRMVEG